MVDRSAQGTANSVPRAVAYVRELLVGFGSPWFLCGGWAADAWLGRQRRDHGDVDIAVFHRDQHAIFEHFAGWALVGHDPNVPDDTAEPWNGSSLAASSAVTHAAFEFEFLLNEGADRYCVLNRDLDIVVPLERCIQASLWGLPTAAAEVVLFFKAGGDLSVTNMRTANKLFRHRDEQDFFALLPTLSEAQCSWLRKSIGKIRPEHPWLVHLD
jgi:hypothetical protein